MSEDKPMYDTGQPQVTNWDATAELLATWREQLPRVTTLLAYLEATRLFDALNAELERFQATEAYKRLAR